MLQKIDSATCHVLCNVLSRLLILPSDDFRATNDEASTEKATVELFTALVEMADVVFPPLLEFHVHARGNLDNCMD